MNIIKKSNKFFKRIFRILLIGILAFFTSGCPTPDYGIDEPVTPDYGVGDPAYGVISTLESTIIPDSDLNEKHPQ